MFKNLSPTNRTRMKEQQLSRTTRQMDLKKRQTNNSSHDKLLFALSDQAKKKQKVDDKKEETIINELDSLNNKMKSKVDAGRVMTEEIFSNSDICTSKTILDSKRNESTFDKENTLRYSHNVIKSSNKEDHILGEAHISILHSYTRDFLFKKIKIVSNSHLEMNGFIMQNVFSKLKLSDDPENIHSMLLADACRTEIRNTISSRRGYVKRKIGLQITGKDFCLLNCYYAYITRFLTYCLYTPGRILQTR